MLTAIRNTSCRALLSLGFATMLLGTLTGCGAVLSGTHDQEFNFEVLPLSGTHNFSGWTEITVGADISSVGPTSLWRVRLDTDNPKHPFPSNVTDLSFLSSLTGTANGTQLASRYEFPAGEPDLDLHIDYLGELNTLFKDSTTFRIDWKGTVNPGFTAWPPGDGIWPHGIVTVNVQ